MWPRVPGEQIQTQEKRQKSLGGSEEWLGSPVPGWSRPWRAPGSGSLSSVSGATEVRT